MVITRLRKALESTGSTDAQRKGESARARAITRPCLARSPPRPLGLCSQESAGVRNAKAAYLREKGFERIACDPPPSLKKIASDENRIWYWTDPESDDEPSPSDTDDTDDGAP